MSQKQNNDQNKRSQLQKQKGQLNSYAFYSGLVIQMAAIIAVGVFVGIKLDDTYPNTNNLFTLFITLTAVVASTIYVIRRIIASSKDN
ncbi:AtpZ/AtpI family protein [Winogradskyella ursingii]|uniref:AtpZ/AtpI family protein n=1 Tax=Winogradskyella ursingii TaxID=2686079 RepID=UPI0021D04D44|nr:AtpZ/AtpI family protein [Winogradskyella ursingii]